MGRLEIQIRHGHDPSPSGAYIALAVLIVLAVVGGAGHRALDGFAHTVLAVVEIAACVVGGLAAAALALVIVLAVTRRARADRRRPLHVQSIRLDDAAARPAVAVPADPGRAALDSPRARRAGWPLAGRWSELAPDDRRGDDPSRYS